MTTRPYWEYLVVVLPEDPKEAQRKLRAQGAFQWELVQIEQRVAYFKRVRDETRMEQSFDEMNQRMLMHTTGRSAQ